MLTASVLSQPPPLPHAPIQGTDTCPGDPETTQEGIYAAKGPVYPDGYTGPLNSPFSTATLSQNMKFTFRSICQNSYSLQMRSHFKIIAFWVKVPPGAFTLASNDNNFWGNNQFTQIARFNYYAEFGTFSEQGDTFSSHGWRYNEGRSWVFIGFRVNRYLGEWGQGAHIRIYRGLGDHDRDTNDNDLFKYNLTEPDFANTVLHKCTNVDLSQRYNGFPSILSGDDFIMLKTQQCTFQGIKTVLVPTDLYNGMSLTDPEFIRFWSSIMMGGFSKKIRRITSPTLINRSLVS